MLAANFTEISPLNEETSRHTNFVNRQTDGQPIHTVPPPTAGSGTAYLVRFCPQQFHNFSSEYKDTNCSWTFPGNSINLPTHPFPLICKIQVNAHHELLRVRQKQKRTAIYLPKQNIAINKPSMISTTWRVVVDTRCGPR